MAVVIDGLLNEVTNAKTTLDGCNAFLTTTLPAMLASAGVPQSVIDKLTADLQASDVPAAQALATALAANTPAQPAGPVVPPLPATPLQALKSKKL
jgi:hypothetical protein